MLIPPGLMCAFVPIPSDAAEIVPLPTKVVTAPVEISRRRIEFESEIKANTLFGEILTPTRDLNFTSVPIPSTKPEVDPANVETLAVESSIDRIK
jgi:hypothetical protein